jgi:predicted CoA-binding protein/GNAT superfamily N-acetyltransferase
MMSVVANPPADGLVATTRLVLRDGSTAGVRATSSADAVEMRRFFHDLSPQSRRLRFLATSEASEELIASLCDNHDPQQSLTLVVCRASDQGTRFVGVASYFAKSDQVAEAAFAVDDLFHGKGIATALLERLADLATDNGFAWFEASVLAENFDMLDVFRDSGFEVRSATDKGCVDVRLSLAPSATRLSAADERDRQATIASLRSILEPHAVAVIGASRDESHLGRRVFDSVRASGFTGPVYPVNPAVTELGGLRCFASARVLPPGVDLAVIAVPRKAVLATVDDCAIAGIKGLVVIT